MRNAFRLLYIGLSYGLVFQILATPVSAAAQENDATLLCLNEPNVRARSAAPFSKEQWQGALRELMAQRPEVPSSMELSQAALIYFSESDKLKEFKSNRIVDKKKHCYVGCRFAKVINTKTAAYFAWYKEYQDLTDCDPATNYDLHDVKATLKGARYASSNVLADSADCFSWCNRNIKLSDR